MQFDDFDKKVREAAEHHHPAYEERAWDQMEKLLDKHLPRGKRRRRGFIFFLLPVLLLGGGVYLWTIRAGTDKVISKNNTRPGTAPAENPPAVEKNPTTEKKVLVETGEADKDLTIPVTTAKDRADGNPVGLKKSATAKALNHSHYKTSFDPIKKKRSFTTDSPLTSRHRNATPSRVKPPAKKDGNAADPQDGVTAGNPGINSNTTLTQTSVAVQPAADDTTLVQMQTAGSDSSRIASASQPADTTQSRQEEQQQDVKKTANQPGKKNNSAFAFTFTMGPDVSVVGLTSIGKLNSIHGAGLSYTYKRFTLRSGFYMVKKVYTADPDDYNPPAHYWTRYVDLTKVEADCKVYEIPVTVSYNFGETKKHSWFAAVGLSSYLMKSEKYHYYYKDQNGNPSDREWSTRNNNNNFSVLNLSAGCEIKINKTLSFMTEPYFKIPLDGIGFGNIQLNSMGMLFTLNVKPFTSPK